MHQKLLSTFLSLCLCGSSLTLGLDTPATPEPAKESGDDAGQRIAAETAASIKALGTAPATRQISAIVFKAVRASPGNVLPIVDATVRASPTHAATEIVTAATAAVPNPWKQVTYHRIARPAAKEPAPGYDGGPTGTQAREGRRYLADEPKSPGVSIGLSARVLPGPGANSADGIQMTLAEAIVRTAFDAEPGLSFRELQDAANAALRMDPAALLRSIQSPSAISGVGDAGASNYANEPLITPKQPAVSR